MFIKRIIQLERIVRGYFFKWNCDCFGLRKVNTVTITDRTPKLIVSLTSYGRRVTNVVPYTLVSLLKQTVMPDRIILWLDRENWNDDNIPKKLQQLIKCGIEIRFCNDIRSYTKLVPTLILCPEDIIITVDDDIVYRKDLIEDLYLAYKRDPYKIYCNMARFPSKSSDGKFIPYEEWKYPTLDSYVMPLGVSGVLYPPKSLYKDVVNRDLFSTLCPIADDLWFWYMALLKGTVHEVLNQGRSIGNSFDDLYQYFHKDSALTHSNRKKVLMISK